MSDVLSWSTTAASNNAAVPDGWPENMNYSAVNNCAREMMAAIARLNKDNNGTITTAGTGNAYTATINQGVVAYTAGLRVTLKADRANTGAATLNLNSIGAAAIVDISGQALRWYDIRANGVYQFVHNGTSFVALNIDTSIDFTGKIVSFSGSIGSIPGGWRLCDGTNGTPFDLRNRFIICAGSTYSVGQAGGATSVSSGAAGNHNHTTDVQGSHGHNVGIGGTVLGIEHMPPHNHINGGASDLLIPVNGTGGISEGFGGGIGRAVEATVGGGAAHAHSAGTDVQGAHGHNISYSGDHAHTVATLPPYLAVAFIMRTAS